MNQDVPKLLFFQTSSSVCEKITEEDMLTLPNNNYIELNEKIYLYDEVNRTNNGVIIVDARSMLNDNQPIHKLKDNTYITNQIEGKYFITLLVEDAASLKELSENIEKFLPLL